MIEKKCPICQKTFQVHEYRKNKALYCSYKCYWKSMNTGRKTFTKICQVCQKQFSTQYEKQIFCSYKCSGKHNQSSFILKNCLTCGKKIIVKNFIINRKKYCSIKCRVIGVSKIRKGKPNFKNRRPSSFKNGKNILCKCCRKSFYVPQSKFHQKYCSRECANKYIIRKPAWNKGKHLSSKAKQHLREVLSGRNNPKFREETYAKGYVFVYVPDHPFKNNQNRIKRSRLVMEKHLNRYLKSTEIIHHMNHIRDDDRIENLILFKNNSAHQKYHYPNGFGKNKRKH